MEKQKGYVSGDFEYVYTACTQVILHIFFFYPHFINRVWISGMGLFYVDIYVHTGLNNFFFQKNRIFAEFFLTLSEFFYTIKMLFSEIRTFEIKIRLPLLSIEGQEKEVRFHENDISAQEAFKSQGSRIQSENEYEGWKKGFSGQTCKRKKSIVRLGHRNVTFLFMRTGKKGRKINEIF